MSLLYRAAVIGCGRIGMTMEMDPLRIKPATHAGAFTQSPLTQLCGLVDSNPKQLEISGSVFPGVSTYTDIKKMLEECHPDIVSVATPPDQHLSSVELCANYHVPAIICEKPIALSKEDGEAIVRICHEARSLLFVNHMRRFDPLMGEVAKKVQDGVLGSIYQGSCYYSAGLFNTATHLIDLLRFILGKDANWVSAIQEPRFNAPHGDMNVNGWIMWDGGPLVSLQALEVNNYAMFEIHLFGSQAALIVDRFGFSVRWIPVIKCKDFSGYNELGRDQSRNEGESRSFLSHLVEHVVDCLEGNSKPLSSGEDGLNVLKILSALQESASQHGQKINP